MANAVAPVPARFYDGLTFEQLQTRRRAYVTLSVLGAALIAGSLICARFKVPPKLLWPVTAPLGLALITLGLCCCSRHRVEEAVRGPNDQWHEQARHAGIPPQAIWTGVLDEIDTRPEIRQDLDMRIALVQPVMRLFHAMPPTDEATWDRLMLFLGGQVEGQVDGYREVAAARWRHLGQPERARRELLTWFLMRIRAEFANDALIPHVIRQQRQAAVVVPEDQRLAEIWINLLRSLSQMPRVEGRWGMNTPGRAALWSLAWQLHPDMTAPAPLEALRAVLADQEWQSRDPELHKVFLDFAMETLVQHWVHLDATQDQAIARQLVAWSALQERGPATALALIHFTIHHRPPAAGDHQRLMARLEALVEATPAEQRHPVLMVIYRQIEAAEEAQPLPLPAQLATALRQSGLMRTMEEAGIARLSNG